jgi:hypothetical protein
MLRHQERHQQATAQPVSAVKIEDFCWDEELSTCNYLQNSISQARLKKRR